HPGAMLQTLPVGLLLTPTRSPDVDLTATGLVSREPAHLELEAGWETAREALRVLRMGVHSRAVVKSLERQQRDWK
ncbi:hypothetical protein P7K49_027893, partial [Saguinus oedipus]